MYGQQVIPSALGGDGLYYALLGKPTPKGGIVGKPR